VLWDDTLKKELGSITKEVFDKLANIQLYAQYWCQKQNAHMIPAKLVTLKKTHHGVRGWWKAKARIVCCGHFKPGSVGRCIKQQSRSTEYDET